MKLATFYLKDKPSFGAITEEGAIDFASLFPDCPSLRALIGRHSLEEIGHACAGKEDRVPLSEVRYAVPIPDPTKTVCIGRNYRDHTLNAGEVPAFPSLFVRLSQTLVAHDAELVKPKLSDQLDYEGELAIVIGRPGRHIPKEQALSHVFGYACFNDGSVRDFQFRHSLTSGKNFDASGSFGPVIVTSDEIPDPGRLTLTTKVNGVEVQRTGTDAMVFDVPSIISYVSGFVRLEPGDVLATGSPVGTGFSRNPPIWLKAGDRLEISISGIGTMRNRVVNETDVSDADNRVD